MVETEPKHFLIQGDVYEVEKLVGVKIVKGKKLFRVRWRGYGRESDTLEPEENLLSCKDMILDLEEKMKERLEKKKKKKLFGSQVINRDDKISASFESSKLSNGITWQATEVQPGPSSKDTFWRDFDEGKINVSDKDMYSKVKERASRTISHYETGKGYDSGQKETPSQPLCPKVLLKRKLCSRISSDGLTYKSSLKVKPMGMHIKKRKKYDILRDYRKRKNRNHRKRNLDENHRCKSSFRNSDDVNDYSSECGQNGSNILQELLINDERTGSVLPDYVLKSSALKLDADKVMTVVPKHKDIHKKSIKDCSYEENMEVKKNHPLKYRITIQDKSKAVYSSYKQGAKSIVDHSISHKSSISSMDSSVRRVFSFLLDAAVNEQLEKVERFCTNIHVVNFCQEDGTTILMAAAQRGLHNVVKILLKANAHKDKQNRKGETALMLACRNGHPKVAKLLLEQGANFAITNADGVNVLRITNQCASKTVLHGILVEHIMRIVSEFETQARIVVEHIAEIKYALFPIQCFSVNEGPKYFINFHHHVKLESPGKSGKQNLLFIANSIIRGNSIKCGFDADSLVLNVSINGVKQELFHKGEHSVFKMTGLKNGNNKVLITTVHHPESEVKMIVCAYRVHRSIAWFPAQKLKSEFLD